MTAATDNRTETPWEADARREVESLAAITAQVAAALGEGWQADTHPQYDHLRELVSPIGARFSVHSDYRAKDRLAFSVASVRDATGEEHRCSSYQGSDPLTVTVSRNRTPEAIAKDLRARFLPTAVLQYASNCARARMAEERRSRTEQNAATVAKASGATIAAEPWMTGNGRNFIIDVTSPDRYCRGYGKIHVSEDTANIELTGVPIALAAKIAALIQQG